MSGEEKGTKIRVLDKEFRINCPADKEEDLYDAASYLDHQMRQIRHSGRVIGLERIAIMAALNISYELLALKTKKPSEDVGGLSDRLQALQHKIDNALTSTAKVCDKMDSDRQEQEFNDFDSAQHELEFETEDERVEY